LIQLNQILEQGLIHHQSGQLEMAKDCYKQILKHQANHPDALHLLGSVAHQQTNYQLAVDLISQAINLSPANPLFLYSHGLALHLQRQFKSAIISYKSAIHLKPDYIEAYINQGNALQEMGCLSEAVVCYQKVIEINYNFVGAHYNRGIILQQLKQFEAALDSYKTAINLKPDFEEAYLNQGIVLKELQKFDAALASYDTVIMLNPYSAEAYNNRGEVLVELKQFDSALASYDRALTLKPELVEAYFNRGFLLKELARPLEARESYLKALELRPDFGLARWALPFLSLPILLNGSENVDFMRSEFAYELEQLERWVKVNGMDSATELVGSSQPFYLAYQELNNKDLLSQYGSICNHLMAHWQVLNRLEIKGKENDTHKIKIGIAGEQIRDHSVWNAITRGLVLNLDPKKFEVHLFHLGKISDEETKLAQSKATTYTRDHTSLLDWANAVLGKSLDVLIYPEIGMHSLTTQLANLRLAPIQIAAWGHPETTGLPTIDYFISAKYFEQDQSQLAYSEQLVQLPNLGCFYSCSPVSQVDFALSKFRLDTQGPILLCPGTLYKYAPQYDWVLVEIVKRIGICKLVFFSQQENLMLLLKVRLEKLFEKAGLKLEDYVIFLPWLNREEFYGLMRCSDVFLDTIGFSGFNTAMQAIECALPIVTLEGQFMRGRLATGILKRMGMLELIAQTEQDYIELAVSLALDKGRRKAVSEKIVRARDILYGDMEPIEALEEFLIKTLHKDHLILS